MNVYFNDGKHNCAMDLNVCDVYLDTKTERVTKNGISYNELSINGNNGYVIIDVNEKETTMQRIQFGRNKIKELDEIKKFDTTELAKDLFINKMNLSLSLTYTMIYNETIHAVA